MNLKQLRLVADGTLRDAISALDKDVLIELKRQIDGTVGDTGKLPKSHFVEWAEAKGGLALSIAAQAILANAAATLSQAPAPITPPATDAAATLAQAIQAVMGSIKPGLDRDAILGLVREELAGRPAPQPTLLVLKDGIEFKAPALRHAKFDLVLKMLNAGVNVALIGPTGCGKTVIFEQIAATLGRTLALVPCSAGMSESHLTGLRLPVSMNEPFRFNFSPFLKAYKDGNAVCVLDEMDRADANTLCVVHSLLANGHIHVPQMTDASPEVIRGSDVALGATMNTFGTGTDPMFAGAGAIDAATLNRFAKVYVDYDRDLERTLADGYGIPQAILTEVWTIREKVQEKRLRRAIATRQIVDAGKLLAAGIEWSTVRESVFLAGWTAAERQQVGA